jgi:outer membrane protein OmpA-like peptidoglycan-associated protein
MTLNPQLFAAQVFPAKVFPAQVFPAQVFLAQVFRAKAFRVACLAVAAVIAGTTVAEADCADLLDRFNSAIAARAISEAKTIEAQIAGDAVCGGRLVDVQRRRAALQLTLVQQLLTPGASGEQAEHLLVEADQPEVLWQAAKAVADLRFSQRRYADATAAFERALEIIRNPAKTPQAPNESMIRQLFERTTQSRLLAANADDKRHPPVYIAAAKDHRDGSPGGSFSENIRGFRPSVIPLPIQFETASAVLSPVGNKAAAELLEALRHQKPKQVTIIGHTDERGGDAFNLRLAEDRVKAVKKFLQEQGIDAQITTVAKGKSEPLNLQDASDLTREDIWALNRRVEWRRD